MVRVLELLVSQLPQTERIVFTDRTGTRTVIVPGKCWLDLAIDYAKHNGHGNGSSGDAEFYDLPFNIWVSPQRDARRSSVKAQIGLELKELERMHKQDSGHHFGGYHRPKNGRQTPSIRHVGGLYSASKAFGLPIYLLVPTEVAFGELQEQREREARVNEIVAGNGKYA